MNNVFFPSLMQLVGQSPVLLAYLVGLILALVFWRRCPGPCLLTLIATGLLLVVAVAQTFLTQYLFQMRAEMGWEDVKVGWMVSAVGLTSNLLRAVAVSLLLTAVILGRRITQGAGPNKVPRPTGPAGRLSEDQGITSRPGG